MAFEYLLKNKNDLIHRTIVQGHVFSLETYLNEQKDFDINQIFEYQRSKWTLLMAACFFKHEHIVRLILRRFKPKIDMTGNVKLDFVHEVMHGVTALWVAVAVGQLDLVKLLIEQGHANVNHLSETRSSPLRAASYIGRLDIARYLIENGADISLVRIGNYTNLMLSAYRQHKDMVKYFLDQVKCDPNERDQDGRTPLHYAVDGGSLDVIHILLDYGAENNSTNGLAPIFWAALEAKPEMVDAFEHHCSSIQQWIEARELLGASFANKESKHYNLNRAQTHLTLAYEWRLKWNLPKPLQKSQPNEAFNYFQECQTLEEFTTILLESNNRLHVEALMIFERILGEQDRRYRRSLRYYGADLANMQQYKPCLLVWAYELDIRQKHDIPLDRLHLREFIRILAKMVNDNIDWIPETSLLKVLKFLDDEISNNRNNDHCLITLFYLITVISHLSENQKNSPRMKDVYQLLGEIIRRDYRLSEDHRQWTLLHMSTMFGTYHLSDRFITAICEYPSYNTIRLLLIAGMDVNVPDAEKNTALHLIMQRKEEPNVIIPILRLLCESTNIHSDFSNKDGRTPLYYAKNASIKTYLSQKMGINRLKCICARKIRQTYPPLSIDELPSVLINFISRH